MSQNTTEQEVPCAICRESFAHYDFLIDHVQMIHSSAEVYSHYSEQNPYRDD